MKTFLFPIALLASFSVLGQGQSCYEDIFPKQAENKLWGYVNLFEEWRVEPVFNRIYPFVGNKGMVEKNGKFGVVGCEGRMIVPADYEEIGPLANGSNFWVKRSGVWALANEKGQIIQVGNPVEIKEVANAEVTWLKFAEEEYRLYDKRKLNFSTPTRFSLFQILSDKASIIQFKEKFGIISHEDGNYFYEPVITSLKKLSANVIAFQDKGKWGILNPIGEVKREAELDSIGFILNNLYYASLNGKCGLISASGNSVLPLEYDELNPFHEHMSLVKKNGAYGYSNLAGKLTVPLIYEWGDIFQNDYAIVKNNLGYFIVDKNNKRITIQNYKWLVKTPSRSFYAAHRDGKYLFLDLTGKEMIKPTFGLVIATDTNQFVRVQNDTTKLWAYFDITKDSVAFQGRFEDAAGFKWGYAFVKNRNLWGVIDEKGKTVLPFQYDHIDYLISNSTPYFLIQSKGNYGLVSSKAIHLLTPEYELITAAIGQLLKVKKEEKYYVLKLDGTEAGKNKYEKISNSKEDPGFPDWPAVIVKKKKYGLLDQNSQEIVKPEYESISYLGDNLYVCSLDAKKGILASNGAVLLPPSMEQILNQSEKYLPVKQKGKWGYVFNTGKIMIVPTYEEVGSFHKNLAFAKLDEKWGVINKQGRWILKNEFDTVTYLADGRRRLQSTSKKVEITLKGIVKQID